MQLWCDASFDSTTKNAGLGITIQQLTLSGIKRTKIKISTTAIDNNHAELLSILYAMKNIPENKFDTRINVITDSEVAKMAILGYHKKPEYLSVVRQIKEINKPFKIYHRKAHTKKTDRYSMMQAISDHLAKSARKL